MPFSFVLSFYYCPACVLLNGNGNGTTQLLKVNACRTSTVAATTTRAFPNGGFATADKIAARETTNSLALNAARKSSGTMHFAFVCL